MIKSKSNHWFKDQSPWTSQQEPGNEPVRKLNGPRETELKHNDEQTVVDFAEVAKGNAGRRDPAE